MFMMHFSLEPRVFSCCCATHFSSVFSKRRQLYDTLRIDAIQLFVSCSCPDRAAHRK
uniref:Uncharacterized protein n=1 Tax=Daphnia magna TaxID=35525 RepID=A0A0P5EN47_9CRUS